MYLELVNLIRKATGMRGKTDPELAAKAVCFYVEGHSLRESARLTGLPEDTVKYWKLTKWFPQACELAKQKVNNSLDRKLTSVIGKGNDLILDRLENGDLIKYKDGTEQRKPLTAYQTALILAIAYDKRALIRNEPTVISEKTDTDQHLKDLRARLENMNLSGGEVVKLAVNGSVDNSSVKEPGDGE